jgi:hypothetical protein
MENSDFIIVPHSKSLSETSPFSSPPDADAILISSDGFIFRVYRRILSEASSVFADTLVMPQPPPNRKKSHVPITPTMTVEETSEILDLLLRFVYPGPNPKLTSLDSLKSLLRAADKYLLSGPFDSLRSILVSEHFLAREPLRVYLIACHFQLAQEAKLASRRALENDLTKVVTYSEMSEVPAIHYANLLKLYHDRVRNALRILETYKPKNEPEGRICFECQYLTAREDKAREDIRAEINAEGEEALEEGEVRAAQHHHVSRFANTPSDLPRWWSDFVERASTQLQTSPLSKSIFSFEFIAESIAKSQCKRCWSLFPRWSGTLEVLKGKVDALPDCVQIRG